MNTISKKEQKKRYRQVALRWTNAFVASGKQVRGCLIWHMVFSATFSYIVAVSFIGAGNQSTRRKLSTCRKSLTNFITYNVVSSKPRHERGSNSQHYW